MKKNKSAIKRARQGEKNRLRNAHVKSTMKTNIKKVLSLCREKIRMSCSRHLRKLLYA